MIVKQDNTEVTFSIRVECTKNLGEFNSIKLSAYVADIPSSATLGDINDLIEQKVAPTSGTLEKMLKSKLKRMQGGTE